MVKSNSKDKERLKYLAETDHFNFSHPAVKSFADKITGQTDKDKAISIYYLVRDSILYNPYIVRFGLDSFKASHAVEQGASFCIPKSGLMVALCRAFNIPARIGLADVRNHLSSEKFIEMIGTDYFAMHGYTEVFLNNRWIKTTPVFNKSLCKKFNVDPLDWDGASDSIFQPMTLDGRKHMEYIVEHGHFADLPLDFIIDGFKKHYPKVFNNGFKVIGEGSFEDDLTQ